MNAKTALLTPIFVPQALWVAARASRLPEASGLRSGMSGEGPRRSLLILGDSSAAGVGAKTQREALAGRLLARLGQHFTVHWQVVAQSGATCASARDMLAKLPDQQFDFVVIALGVNDVKNGVGLGHWKQRYAALVQDLTSRFRAARICLCGVPPLGAFPLLPWPLNAVLGARASRFDAVIQTLAQQSDNGVHLPMHFPMDVSSMASDGFHPGPEVYAEWARRAAVCLVPDALTRSPSAVASGFRVPTLQDQQP
ncbi:MAG: SGNH/GDSL hydrolase family protein [Pseudomonadota bacterium]